MGAKLRCGLAVALALTANASAAAEPTIADYLQKGWEIKAAWEGGMVLKKAEQAVVCYVTGDVAIRDRANYLKNVHTVACSIVH